MDIKIRKAGLTDLELLIKWRMEVLLEVFSIPAGQSMQKLEQENRVYYKDAIPKEEHLACFALADKRIIGCGGVCLYREMPSPDNTNGKCAYLMNIYTLPGFRGHGAGRKTVNWLLQQATEKGATKIYLETSAHGRPLYQEMGFCDMYGYMKLKE